MALKAGRVGLATELVDEFGYLREDAPSGQYYTKTQADNKFETKTHVNNTFQKKTLEVPIEMLSGTKLTVETALEGLNTEKQNTQLSVPIEMLSGSKLTVETALNGLNEEKFDRAEQRVLGAKNRFDTSKAQFKNGGLTCVVNADGSISISAGTTTEEFNFPNLASYSGCYDLKPATEYIFSIGNAVENLRLRVYYKETSGSDWVQLVSESNVENIHFTTPSSFYTLWVRIDADSDRNIASSTLYPMIRLASDPDDTYEPYAMTNRELTELATVNNVSVTFSDTSISVDSTNTKIKECGHNVTGMIDFTLGANAINAWSNFVTFGFAKNPNAEVRVLALVRNITDNDVLSSTVLLINTSGVAQTGNGFLANKRYQVSFTVIKG